MADLVELSVAWAHGWAKSRGRPSPVAVDGGLVIGGAAARYVLRPDDWEWAARFGRELTVAGTEIKIVGAAASLRQALQSHWSLYGPHHLMTSAFMRGVVELPPGCSAQVVADGSALVGSIRNGAGDLVSSARLAAYGRFGVIDRVRTRERDQRRGLGRAVMTLVGNHALDEGLSTGLLSATAEGRALYGSLGWTVHAELAGAFRNLDVDSLG